MKRVLPALPLMSGAVGLAILAAYGPEALLVVLFGVGLAVLFARLYVRAPGTALLILIGLGTFESVVFMAAMRFFHLPAQMVNALLSVKFLMLCTAAGTSLIYGRRAHETAPDITAYLLMAYGLSVLAFFFQQNLSHYSVLPQIRAFFSFITPVLLYIAARFSNMSTTAFSRLLKGTIAIAFLAAAFGLVERFLLPVSFWDALGLPAFLSAKGALPTLVHGGSEDILGSAFSRRLIGPFDYPLNAAYFLIVPIIFLCAALFDGRLRKFRPTMAMLLLVLGTAESLTLSRGAIGGLLIAVFLLLLSSAHARRFIPVLLLIVLVIAISPAGHSLITQTLSLSDPSARNHVVVLGSDMRNAFNLPFGGGFGTAGFAAIEANGYTEVGENLFATIGSQAGIVGIAIFLAFVISIASHAHRSAQGFLLRSAKQAVLFSTIAFMIGSLTTEHWQALESSGVFWILAGAVISREASVIGRNSAIVPSAPFHKLSGALHE